MVEYLNQKYRIPNNLPPKSQKDCKDWGYRSIWKNLSTKEMEGIFNSEEFWSMMKLKPGFIKILESRVLDDYSIVFVTKGEKTNTDKKLKFLQENGLHDYIPNFEWYALPLHLSKNTINMKDGIMVDDNFFNFEGVNSRLNILVKNNIETQYNNSFRPIQTMDNLYIVNEVSDIIPILRFCSEKSIIL